MPPDKLTCLMSESVFWGLGMRPKRLIELSLVHDIHVFVVWCGEIRVCVSMTCPYPVCV